MSDLPPEYDPLIETGAEAHANHNTSWPPNCADWRCMCGARDDGPDRVETCHRHRASAVIEALLSARVSEECETCGGEGILIDEDADEWGHPPCPNCKPKGSGRVTTDRSLLVDVLAETMTEELIEALERRAWASPQEGERE